MQFRELKGYSYGHRSIGNRSKTPFLKEHIYAFKTAKNNSYTVRLEEYANFMFVLKFHLQVHSNSKMKYVLLTGLRDDPRRIIETCIMIGHEVRLKYPLASFGFLGSPIIPELKKGRGEMLKITKRYNLYRKFAANYFSTDNYLHYAAPDSSTYLLINKEAHKKRPSLLTDIVSVFDEYDLEGMFCSILREIEKKEKKG